MAIAYRFRLTVNERSTILTLLILALGARKGKLRRLRYNDLQRLHDLFAVRKEVKGL